MSTAPPSSRGDELRELTEQNDVLAEENAALRQLLAAQTQQTEALRLQQEQNTSTAGGISNEQLEELLVCRQQLKVANAMAERQYEELLELRRRCAIYANAIAEGKQAMEDMKALHSKLAQLTSSVVLSGTAEE